jgi:hypothetical protein
MVGWGRLRISTRSQTHSSPGWIRLKIRRRIGSENARNIRSTLVFGAEGIFA